MLQPSRAISHRPWRAPAARLRAPRQVGQTKQQPSSRIPTP